MELIGLGMLLIASSFLNVYFYFRLIKKPDNRKNSVELQEFLNDLMAGKKGIFAVSRINSDDILLRSPRSRND